MSKDEIIARRLRIAGRVQGVWYRDSMRRQAESLNVEGWVKNIGDGRVEAWIEGASLDVDSIIAWARQGPPLAQVEEVLVEVVVPSGYRGFAVLQSQ